MSLSRNPVAPKNAARPALNRLALGVLAALLLAPLAQAQEAAAEPAKKPAASEQHEVAELGEVMVSARKRDERQLDVPIAMSAVTGATIEAKGLLNVTDIINTTPGATSIDIGGSFTQVQIRGVSSSLGGNDNGYYLDETPFTGVTVPWYPDARSFDIERVEVLKGPQGTLFGEGSMGGTVRIITNKPDFNYFNAGVEAGTSATEGGGAGHGFKGMMNVPLIDDRLALRVAVTDEKTPGWVDNSVTGERNVNDNAIRTARAKLRFAATDNWTIDLSHWRYKSDSDAASNAAFNDMTNTSFLAAMNKWHSSSLVSTWELEGSQIVYAFSDANLVYAQNGELAPGLGFDAVIDIGVRTQELRWASTGDRTIDWTTGYYLRDAVRKDDFDIPGIVTSTSNQTNEAYAVFGEATWKFAPDWSLTGGLRYFKDKVDAWDRAEDGTTSTLDASFKSWNPRLSLSYKPTENTTVYSSAARGFRSGQLQPISSILLGQQFGVALPPTIDPDSIWTYEVGLKSLFDEGRVLVEGAIFHSDWKGVAVRVPITAEINGLANSKGTRNRGVEVSVVYNPIKALTLQLAGSYIDAVYVADVPGTPLHKGTAVYNVPKTSLMGSAAYTWQLDSGNRAVLSGSVNHDSARETSLVSGAPGDKITLANLRLGLESPSGWAGYLYGNNLTNEDGAIDARNLDGAANRPQPRTFGMLVRYNY